MSTVTATYTNATGDPASGTVYLSPVIRAPHGDTIVTEKRVWADLDSNGSVSLDVLASDSPDWKVDGEVVYLVEERLQGLPFRSYYIGVPTEGVDLADVQQAEPDVVYVPITGSQGPAGPQGPEGPQGDPGPPGAATLSGWWQYATQTTGPAAEGEVRTDPNLGAIDSTGTLWLSSTDADGLDWSMVSPNVGDQVVLRSASGESWTLTVDAVVATGEWTVTLNSSTGTAPKRNERVQVSLVQPSLTQEQADARYVNADGDTMTGALVIDGPVNMGAAASVVVPTPTAASQAAQVTAIDSSTGRLAIGGIEMGDTGWRVIDLSVWTGQISLRRQGNLVTLGGYVTSWNGSGKGDDLPSGFRCSIDVSDRPIFWASAGTSAPATNQQTALAIAGASGESLRSNQGAASGRFQVTYPTSDPWPTTLPGVPT